MVKIPKAPQLDGFPLKPIILGLVVLVVLISAGFWALDFVETRQAEKASEEQAYYQQNADDIANRIASSLIPYRKLLQELASKPAITDALALEREQRKKIAVAEIAEHSAALLLRILLPGETQSQRSESPPLTFASIEMLKSAVDTDKPTPVEIHLGGTDNEHLVMLERIADGDALRGFLHLSISSDVIREAIKAQNVDGYLEIRQRAASGPPVVIARHGTPSTSQNSVVAKVPGTAFLASYRFSDGAETGSALPDLAVPAGAVAVVLLLLALLFSKRKTGSPTKMSDVEYAGAIKSVLDGSPPGLTELLPGGSGKFPEQEQPEKAPTEAEQLPSGLDIDFDLEETKTSDVPKIDVVDQGPQDIGIEVSETTTEELATLVPNKIFRSYDIRGVVGESLTPDGVYQIGRALGTEAKSLGEQTVVVARDGRNSSADFRNSLIEGLRDSGCDVLDVGMVPTPVLYFATHYLDSRSGVMITGSHNPPEYNGLKIVLNGKTLCGDAIQSIRNRVESQEYESGEGVLQSMEIIPDYIRRVGEEVPVTFDALKVVVDCANSVPGIVAPHILRAIGHDVVELYCDVDGDFPNHHPDPSQPKNLEDLIEAVQREEADIGLAFDGDGDRLGVVDNEGNIIWPDQQLMLFARSILAQNPGAKVVYDVKCSTSLPADIEAQGGEALMSPTGHSIIKQKMEESGALLAGDLSGHIFFKDRWYGFDDALYAAARILEIIVESDRAASELFAELPGGVVTPEIHIPLDEEQHQTAMEKILSAVNFEDAKITTLDGLRADFSDSWGLIRPSNTVPALVLRFEGENDAALEAVKEKFRQLLQAAGTNLEVSF